MALPWLLLASFGAQTLGGILGSLFQRKAAREAAGDYQQLLNSLIGRSPEALRGTLFAPAGTVGEQVRSAFEIALASLTPSAEAAGAAAALRETAARLPSVATTAAEAQRRQAEAVSGEFARQALGALTRSTLSPTALAATAPRVGQAVGQATAQATQAGLGAVLQALQQGAGLETTATQLTEASRSERFRTNVAPYMASSSPGVFASLVGAVPRYETLLGERPNPLAGLAAGLGSVGTQLQQAALSPLHLQQLLQALQMLGFNQSQ